MTMLPPKIKKIPNLHKPIGYVTKPQQGSTHSNRSMIAPGKMVR
jgi:hypothetical protein